MTIEILVEDRGWDAIAGLSDLARRAADLTVAEAGCGPFPVSLVILFANDAVIRALNRQWRDKDEPTNVLSFPAVSGTKVPAGEPRLLGDLVLAFETVSREAAQQRKPLPHHVTHLIVHGTLHLLGHDHDRPTDAEAMEAMERMILGKFGIADPYEQ